MGIVCPLGLGAEHVWQRLIDERIRASAPSSPSTSAICPRRSRARCRMAPGPRASSTSPSGSRPRTSKKMDRFIHFAMVGRRPRRSRTPAGSPRTEEDRCATGVMIGSGIGGLETIYDASIQMHEGKARRLSPFFIPSALINLASGQLSIKYGFKGPNHAVVTACATGVHAIGDAARLIMLGRRRRDGRGRRRGDGLPARHRRVLRQPRALHRLQRRRRRRPRARGTRTATGS